VIGKVDMAGIDGGELGDHRGFLSREPWPTEYQSISLRDR
jgi:hypothetical protein